MGNWIIGEPNAVRVGDNGEEGLHTKSIAGVKTYINAGAVLKATVFRKLGATLSVSAGSETVTADQACFEDDDVGKSIVLEGAGDNDSWTFGAIAAVNSSTEIELEAAVDEAAAGIAGWISLENGEDQAASYVASSDGKYEAVFPGTVPASPNQELLIRFYGTTGSGTVNRFLRTYAQHKTYE